MLITATTAADLPTRVPTGCHSRFPKPVGWVQPRVRLARLWTVRGPRPALTGVRDTARVPVRSGRPSRDLFTDRQRAEAWLGAGGRTPVLLAARLPPVCIRAATGVRDRHGPPVPRIRAGGRGGRDVMLRCSGHCEWSAC